VSLLVDNLTYTCTATHDRIPFTPGPASGVLGDAAGVWWQAEVSSISNRSVNVKQFDSLAHRPGPMSVDVTEPIPLTDACHLPGVHRCSAGSLLSSSPREFTCTAQPVETFSQQSHWRPRQQPRSRLSVWQWLCACSSG
jgi:hypothetical protein